MLLRASSRAVGLCVALGFLAKRVPPVGTQVKSESSNGLTHQALTELAGLLMATPSFEALMQALADRPGGRDCEGIGVEAVGGPRVQVDRADWLVVDHERERRFLTSSCLAPAGRFILRR